MSRDIREIVAELGQELQQGSKKAGLSEVKYFGDDKRLYVLVSSSVSLRSLKNPIELDYLMDWAPSHVMSYHGSLNKDIKKFKGAYSQVTPLSIDMKEMEVHHESRVKFKNAEDYEGFMTQMLLTSAKQVKGVMDL